MTSEIAPAVIFIFLNDKGQVLMETLPAKSSYPQEDVIPGGKVEPGESFEECLLREVQEELGVIPLSHKPLSLKEQICSPKGRTIHPYVISKWKGQIPEVIIDKGYPLRWSSVEEVLNSPVESMRKLAATLIEFKNNDSC